MHRWFFADDRIVSKEPAAPATPLALSEILCSLPVADTSWNFNVKCNWKLCPNESLAVCGSVPELGNWNPKLCLLLNRETDSSCWSLAVLIPHKDDIYYRYLVCATNESGQKIVRFWETHEEARCLSRSKILSLDNDNWDIFGLFNDKYKIERGWISSNTTVVQFKLYKSPFVLKTSQIPSLLYVKLTPIKVKEREKCEKVINEKPSTEGSFKSLDEFEADSDRSSPFAFCEVSSLKEGNEEFHKQPEYGTPCGSDDILMFHLTLSDFKQTAYLIDLFKFAPKAASDVPAQHFGYQYVFCQDLKGSEGTLNLTIMCTTKHRPIGCVKCDYLVVKPMSSHDFKMERKFQRNWSPNKACLLIGHRGCGISFWFKKKIVRENTIDSFNLAFTHGADMVEFDVQLTKDGIPILYHDFQLYLTGKSDMDTQKYDLMKLPIKASEIDILKPFARHAEDGLKAVPLSKFTYDQLQRNKDCELEGTNIFKILHVEDVETNRPFVALKTVLGRLNSKLGFLVELKWPQRYTNGTTQEHFIQDFDKNEYVDTILNEILTRAGSRHIVFTSYDADICTMIQMKQIRYPVLFAVHDSLSNAQYSYWDSRSDSFFAGIYFAKAMELLGISTNCCDILETPAKVSSIHKRDLCLFSWGTSCRQEDTRKYLKTLGVDGIIFDRINYSKETPDLKRAVYLLEFLEESLENK